MIDLGWHNAGGDIAEKINATLQACWAQGHLPSDRDMTWPRGIDHEVTCEQCGYKYHYDSSD